MVKWRPSTKRDEINRLRHVLEYAERDRDAAVKHCRELKLTLARVKAALKV